MNKQLLIIGRPHSSKTVFLTQFYSRLQKKKSKLSLYKPVDDLTPISAAREALANGDEPIPTNAEKTDSFFLPVKFEEEKIDLLCPEYGGEQINNIIDTRNVEKNWEAAVLNSDSWIFFIRMNSLNKPLDISDIAITEDNMPDQDANTVVEYNFSDQSSLIELLQIFLHTKNYNYHLKNKKVKLTIVLTCWDEIETDDLPKDVLLSRLPLLQNFIESNWESGVFKVIGLSALGFPLNIPENKDKYQIEGPENFGYLIKEDGIKTKDITELILEAL